MVLDPQALLRRLEPAVRRGGPAPAIQRVPGIAEAGFGDLLTMVASGRIRSDRAVFVAPDAAIEPPLDESQLERLAAAADEAEAAGARRAIMLLDGRGIVMDLAGRRIDAEARPGSGPLTDIDAAVAVPGDPRTNGEAETAGDGAILRGSAAAAAPVGRIGRPLGPPPALPAHIARAIPEPGTRIAMPPGARPGP
jgi:hypothetical protein